MLLTFSTQTNFELLNKAKTPVQVVEDLTAISLMVAAFNHYCYIHKSSSLMHFYSLVTPEVKSVTFSILRDTVLVQYNGSDYMEIKWLENIDFTK